MSKADHMLSILWMLKSGKRMTAKQLADELELHVRTVYRYIDALCASGVPIIADSGHNGGYSLLHEFTDAPLLFDLEEQKALVHAAIFAQEAGYPYGNALNRAVTKLKRYTNPEQSDAIDRHTAGFDVIHGLSDGSAESVLQELETSVADGYTLVMEYHKGYGKTPPESRRIDPYGLVFWKGRWYMVGYCHLRGEIRSFRTDRIQALSRTEHRFERPDGFSARQHFLGSLLPDSEPSQRPVSVRIHGRPQALNDLCGHWFLEHALVERTEEEAHFMLEERAVDFLPHLLLSYGRSLHVEEPQQLKEKMVNTISALLKHYEQFLD